MFLTNSYGASILELEGEVVDSGEGNGPQVYMLPTGVPMEVKIKRVDLTTGWKQSPQRRDFARGVLRAQMRDYATKRSRIMHQHILQLVGFKFANDDPLFISPWCTNRSLPEYLQSYSQPANRFQDALNFFRQVANGLAHIHTLEPPIHHGNLKPSKILVDYDNNENLVKITDVGYLEFRNAVEETISFTQVDTMGFAGYPAPETLAANVSSPAADIYALAATILHVISESFPPHADAIRVVEIMKGNKPARVDHPGIPKDHPLWALLENMWTFEAANRPRAGKVQFAIQWIQQHPTEAEKVFCEQCDVVYVPPEKNNLERKGLGEA